MQFVLVAEGDDGYETGFREFAARYPRQVAVQIGYEEALGHRVLAGADMLLHPARFEPCGLVPIYAMRYGALPLVRESGGMADTVVDASPDAIRQGTATGFSFQNPSAEELIGCVDRALSLFHLPIAWRRLQAAAMRQDFSWERSADAYAELYRSLTGRPSSETSEEPSTAPPSRLTKLTA
jgi:starch synthase